jgi:hypothetical protein
VNLLDDIFSPHHYLGLCSECGQAKTFITEHARDLWERFHTHDPSQSGDGA